MQTDSPANQAPQITFDDPAAVDSPPVLAAPPKRVVSHNALVLLGVISVACGVLYAMRLGGGALATDAAVIAVESKIELALAQLNGPQADPRVAASNNLQDLFQNTDKVVAMFTEDPAKRQVPLDKLARNPFMLNLQKPRLPQPDAQPEAGNPGSRPANDEISKLKLQTIMQGRVPMAVISGHVVRENDKLGSMTVYAIRTNAVELAAGTQRFTLTMDSGQPGPGTR